MRTRKPSSNTQGINQMSEKRTGRPSTFSQEVADVICERIAAGESLRGICKSDNLPADRTIWKWLADFQDFAEQYTAARARQADTYADELVQIADEKPPVLENGGTDSGFIADKRLRIDARKWVASKLLPKKYGERQVLAGDPDAPLVTTVTHLVDIAASLESVRQIEVEDDEA